MGGANEDRVADLTMRVLASHAVPHLQKEIENLNKLYIVRYIALKTIQ